MRQLVSDFALTQATASTRPTNDNDDGNNSSELYRSTNMTISTAYSITPRRSQVDTGWITNAIVISTALFNALLAFANAHIVQLNSTAVVTAECALDILAIAVALLKMRKSMLPWLFLIIGLCNLSIFNAIVSQRFDPKLLRDVLIVPIFVLLGLTADRQMIVRVTILLQGIVVAVMLFEAIRPEEFGRFLNIMSYYIHTRGFEESNFWAQDQSQSDLFVSAMRPGERFLFPSLGIHRLSSIFLEPVSLGNYCVIIGIILASLWEHFSKAQRLFLVITSILILIGCDGRFATVNIFVLIILRFVAPKLPRYSNFVYLPLVLITAAMIVNTLGLSAEGDDFPTRTAGSIYALGAMSFSALFGADTGHAYGVMDSGIAYLLYSQSLIGAALLWIFIAFGIRQIDKPSTIFSNGTSAYFALNLMISYSVFSIKTAGLLWFVFGAIQQTNDLSTKKQERVLTTYPEV